MKSVFKNRSIQSSSLLFQQVVLLLLTIGGSILTTTTIPVVGVVVTALKAEWISIPTSQKISPRRSGHTAFTTTPSKSAGGTAYVFGGYVEEDATKEGDPYHREVRNDLWKFDYAAGANKGWIQCQPSTGSDDDNNMPGPRLATASAVDSEGKFAYVFGGWDPQTPGTGGIILEEVHKLDLQTLEWSLIDAKIPDGPTSRHVALTLLPAASSSSSSSSKSSSEILIHNHRCLDHVLIFDTKTETFRKQKTFGKNPGSLGLHTATILGGDDKLVVFGGAAKDGQMSNNCHVLNLQTWEWNPVEFDASGACPSPRAGACLCTFNENIACLFGGAETTETGLNPKGDVWALHLEGEKFDKGRWELLLGDKTEGDDTMPEPRNAATLTKVDSNKFLLTGGWAPFRQTWDDVFILSIED